MGFFGNFLHTLDEKGRVFVPSKFRDALGKKFILTKGIDPCLYAYTMQDFRGMVAKIMRAPISDGDARDFKRHVFANAAECEMDKQGRINIPQGLVDYAKLDKDICFAGTYDHLELWANDAWLRRNSKYDDASMLAEKMHRYLDDGFGAAAPAGG
jgi:MraZ protein